ncbi:MAG: 5-formyltetrahydrofolate cyclo-ligase [Devosia sp.]|nr:5-formyltetrahydrofolate cyclo-ligase [Devosia sp.]
MEIVMTDRGRWAGRNPAKDELRNAIWDQLVADGVAIGPARSHIPNFTGADNAAWHMTQIPAWKTAKAVKVNPDSAQYSLRLRALYEGKTLYCPVPELVQSAPYVRIDPAVLQEKGITFELAASHQGYMHHGERIEFTDIPELDFCVFGSVAVTRQGARTGKGGGFADLEAGVLNELGRIRPDTPLVTSVHSTQVVPDGDIVMMHFDCWMDYVATEKELITTNSQHTRPKGISWENVQPDQFESIPFLRELQANSAQ